MSKLNIEDDMPASEQLKEQKTVADDGTTASAMSASGFTPSLVEPGPVEGVTSGEAEPELDGKSEAGSIESSLYIYCLQI